MCGIVGYIGKNNALKPVVDGLKTLEYRGYDSAGVAYLYGDEPFAKKEVGRVDRLEAALGNSFSKKINLAIGHTRWATHGSPTVANAHPHFNKEKTIFVVHNGIIENFMELKSRLEKSGYEFLSQTDTEVIPHLIDFHLRETKDFAKAIEKSLLELQGAYALAVIYSNEPEKLYAARLSSPLVLGVGNNEYILASDPTAIINHTNEVVYLDDYELLTITNKNYKIKNIKKSKPVKRLSEKIEYDIAQAQLGDYPNFMLKEIFEAPQTIKLASLGRVNSRNNIVKLGGLESVEQNLKNIDRIIIVACGTSYYAGLLGEYLIEEIAGIPVEVQLASEFKYRSEPISNKTALLAISQSGETADTIAALKKVEDYGVLRLGVVNAVGSTIARLTDAGVYCHAGPEMAVASTKAFIAQVTVLTQIALKLSDGKTKLYKPLIKEIESLPSKAEKLLDDISQIEELANKYSHFQDFLYIGRGYLYPTALEGALKLKELTYIHAEGYAAGEMKHGPLAMIDKEFATVALALDNTLLDKTYSNIEEIKARSGPVLAIATAGNKKIRKLVDDVIYVPETLEQTQPLLAAIVLQLFTYYMSLKLGHNVDRPRNLAKSVTVE